MKKIRIWSATILISLLALCFSMISYADAEHFASGTRINSYDVSGMTCQEVRDKFKSIYDNYTLTLKEKNNATESLTGTQMMLSADVKVEDVKALLDAQNAAGGIAGDNIYLDCHVTYDDDAIKVNVYGLNCISSSNIIKTENAHLSSYDESRGYTIVKEVQGNDIDVDILMARIKDCITGSQTELDLSSSGCYRYVTVRSTDDSIKYLLDIANKLKGMTITLTIGAQTEVISTETIVSFISGSDASGTLQVDRDKVLTYVQGLSSRYSSVGTSATFPAYGGRYVEVPISTTGGWQMNIEAETDQIVAMIQAKQSVTHDVGKPITDWGNTYIEVDKQAQHVYYIVENQLVWESPCVTGTPNSGRESDSGVFAIYSKETNRTLVGPNYRSFVSYWMPYNKGEGLHDATWRSTFGGNIYKTNGSHGCINLPKDKAAELYNIISVGTKVIVHD